MQILGPGATGDFSGTPQNKTESRESWQVKLANSRERKHCFGEISKSIKCWLDWIGFLLPEFVCVFLRIDFWDEFRFTAKLRGRYRGFPCTLCPHTCTALATINNPPQSGTFVIIDEPTLTCCYHPKSIVNIGLALGVVHPMAWTRAWRHASTIRVSYRAASLP